MRSPVESTALTPCCSRVLWTHRNLLRKQSDCRSVVSRVLAKPSRRKSSQHECHGSLSCVPNLLLLQFCRSMSPPHRYPTCCPDDESSGFAANERRRRWCDRANLRRRQDRSLVGVWAGRCTIQTMCGDVENTIATAAASVIGLFY